MKKWSSQLWTQQRIIIQFCAVFWTWFNFVCKPYILFQIWFWRNRTHDYTMKFFHSLPSFHFLFNPSSRLQKRWKQRISIIFQKSQYYRTTQFPTDWISRIVCFSSFGVIQQQFHKYRINKQFKTCNKWPTHLSLRQNFLETTCHCPHFHEMLKT